MLAGFDLLNRREVLGSKLGRWVDAALVNRNDMTPGTRVSGPAAIVERETTTIVTAAYHAIAQADGCLLVQRKGEAHE